ncbi:MAG: putative metal-binding motif-containing protein, partial [Gammaproteobacteria bacterium]|nr:putative metal-binding motif-containing protein [Gammaproteobacteria bacterium]
MELSSTNGIVGDEVVIYGYGFSAEVEIVSITFGGDEITTTPNIPETDSLGSCAFTFTVPDKVNGDYSIAIEDENGVSAAAVFTIGPVIVLDVDGGSVGSVVAISGRGFTANGIVDNIEIDGAACSTLSLIGINGIGEFAGEFVIPSVADMAIYEIIATDDSGLSAVADFEVTGLAGIDVDPRYGSPGSTISYHGYNFSNIAGEDVSIELWDKDLSTKIVDLDTIQTLSNGEFTGTFYIPAVNFDIYYLMAIQTTYGINTTSGFRVGIIAVIIDPSVGLVGTPVTITGVGFTASGLWDAAFGDQLILDNMIVDPDTTFEASFDVPDVSPGFYTVTVTDISTGIFLILDFEVTGVIACVDPDDDGFGNPGTDLIGCVGSTTQADNCPDDYNPNQEDTELMCMPIIVACPPGVINPPGIFCYDYMCIIDPLSDGVGNVCDNCPQVKNSDQSNSDSDSLGDVCDNCWFASNEDQLDSDLDCPQMPLCGGKECPYIPYVEDPRCGDACDICPFDTANDNDNDGYCEGSASLPPALGGNDCNDNDPTRYPGAPEKCSDGIDQD